MSQLEKLFNEAKQLTIDNDEKFFMNVHDYHGKRLAVFDYSLVIPAHFSSNAAFECRGSVFEVDENNNFVDIVCRPYEKFLNLHEYDYLNNEPLYAGVKEKYGVDVNGSEDLKNLEIAYALNKEDGSIISSFMFDGELDVKSNSSLTSDYKYIGLELLKKDQDLYQKTLELTQQRYTVNFEFVSDHWRFQIVLPYDEERLIVTGVRNNDTGEYLTHQEMVEHFGQDKVVEIIEHWDWSDVDEKENIEGYVIVFKCGLRCKLKTRWYIDRHNLKSELMSSPRHFWEMFIKDDLDDVYALIKDDEKMRQYFDKTLKLCTELYKDIMHDGYEYYENNKHLEAKDYFKKLKTKTEFKYFMSNVVASRMFQCEGDKSQVMEYVNDKLMIRRNISKLGIIEWE